MSIREGQRKKILENLHTDEGIIWKVDRFATHDGPGIRTNLYFKGCALRCRWCSNPEGQKSAQELVFFKSKCAGRGFCAAACPRKAIHLMRIVGDSGANLEIDRTKCNLCGKCISVCPNGALEIWGKKYTTQEVVDILEKDRTVHRRSGGGVTLTGGDPLWQCEFTLRLLQVCRKLGIHTAIETSGYLEDQELFKEILHEVDWLFIDLKHMSEKDHLLLTGRSNDFILRNLRLASHVLADRQSVLVVRMVVIPGINDSGNIYDMANFLHSLPLVTAVELLPYHAYGSYKYDLLGRSYSLTDTIPPTAEVMARAKTQLESQRLVVIEQETSA